jgi:acyl-CoA thioesterase-1
MRVFLTLFLIIAATTAQAANSPTVVVFGDSLSAGYGIDVDQSWVALLQTRLSTQGYEHRVINASISGETTEGGKTRIRSALERFGPDLIILELGGNDGLRGFPPEIMKENLRAIIETSKQTSAAVVLLGIRIPTNYGPRYTQAFEGVYRELAAELSVPWIEFFMEGIALNDELMQDDGIHPNAEAQTILLENAWPIIHKALSDQATLIKP